MWSILQCCGTVESRFPFSLLIYVILNVTLEAIHILNHSLLLLYAFGRARDFHDDLTQPDCDPLHLQEDQEGNR